jgi:hypothetical protein
MLVPSQVRSNHASLFFAGEPGTARTCAHTVREWSAQKKKRRSAGKRLLCKFGMHRLRQKHERVRHKLVSTINLADFAGLGCRAKDGWLATVARIVRQAAPRLLLRIYE